MVNQETKSSDKKNPRVMHFVPYFLPHQGGLEMYVKEWAENYVKIGGECSIVTFSGGQKEKELYREENGYNIIILPAFDIVNSFPFPKFWKIDFWRGISAAKKWKADVIHTHTRFFVSSFLGGLLSKIWKTLWIHIEHGSGFVVTKNILISFFSRLYDITFGRIILFAANDIIAISEACRDFISTEFGIKNVPVIYRGINYVIPKVEKNFNEIRIGYVGRLVDLKGVDVLINAFAIFLKGYKDNKDIKLIIIGDGPERKKLESLVEGLGIGDMVNFLGIQGSEKVRSEYLPSFHIFVNPSFQEGLPTSVMEAIVAGCNVIATDVGGTREIYKKISFTLIEPKRIDLLSKAITREVSLIKDSELSKYPISLFSWADTFKGFLKMYGLHNLN
ncbi:glycosyltransferase family 4 protein [Candidatus Gracilibacteria bacterium]|nr:glycosyltransferase family 4 protein [Candidatus Gracilibacteria bacterium]